MTELQEVAHTHGLVEDERQPTDDILERFLRSERHRNPADA
jgi:hypothetical protein